MPLSMRMEKSDHATREYERSRKYRQRKQALPEFVAVDGEGTGRNENHRYVLLGVGDQQYENPNGISWQEAFRFLYDQYLDRPDAVYVGFFLGYDFAQILKTMEESRARVLLTKDGIRARKRRNSGGNNKPFPVRADGWEFDMLGSRRLQLRPLVCDCDEIRRRKCTHKRPGWMYICDAGPFWQCSLLSAIDPKKWTEPVVTDAEFELVARGKARRDSAVLDDEMRFYNRLENDILARIMGRLAQGFAEIDVRLSRGQWFGPGQAAAAWLRGTDVPKRDTLQESVPDWFWTAAQDSYYGGWFEIFAHGIIEGWTYEYDINSAYPAVIRNLPCLLHGRWSQGDGAYSGGGSNYVLCDATVHAATTKIGGAMHRDRDGRILRPTKTRGIHWRSEIDAGIRAGIIGRVEYHSWFAYEPCNCMSPARRVENLYDRRLAVGKNTVLGIAAKLVYNSMYGKFAQSVGAAPYGNWIYASLITSGCRTAILNAIGSHPRGIASVVMVATDAVFFDSPHPGLPISDQLGEWDEGLKGNLALFKPGVYWDNKARDSVKDGEAVKFKARGISAQDFKDCLYPLDERFVSWHDGIHIPEWREEIYRGDAFGIDVEKGWPTIRFHAGFSMITPLQALMRNDWSQAGQVAEGISLAQSAAPYDKRWKPYYNPDKKRVETLARTLVDYQTVPYSHKVGLQDPNSPEYANRFGAGYGELVIEKFVAWQRTLAGKDS